LPEYKNPQQEPGMERRLLVVFALTFLIILISQPLLKKYLPKPAEPTPQVQQPQTAPVNPPPPGNLTAQAEATAPPTATRQASAETETVVENDLYRIRFTNRGGQVKSWVLKKYDDDSGKPLELVNTGAADKYGYPLSLWAYDESLRNKLNSALYVGPGTDPHAAPADITFEYSDQDVSVRKTFQFDHTYVVKMETSVFYKGSVVAALPMWPAGFGDETNPAAYAASQIEYQNDGKIDRLSVKKISGGATLPGPFQWAGVTDRYFAAVFLPEDTAGTALVTLNNSLDVPRNPQKPDPKEITKVEVLGAAVGNLKGATIQRMYVGPKDLKTLEAIPVPTIAGGEPPDLRGLVDFGWLGLIARPLFLWLKWTYNHMVANWGWSIVIQTLIINVALLPLRLSQMKSMLKMQRVAPQIKAIQEKYKKYSMRDPKKQEMNQEIAALYKQHGVNPAGGCLPLLIQMPFLFAYYRMLNVALDLRHAHWLWIRDLSSPDPWHILPVAIIISMLFMQRMTPQPGMDPVQQRMMNFMMPVFLGFVSLNLAAGLCLYWSEGNLIGIVQQAIMNRTTLGREMREMLEKRARKKDK
jgi:YidC/Oxa1 family membrane protein insertase